MIVRRTTLLAASLVLGAAVRLSAQAPAGPTCAIEDGKPGQVKGARDAIVKSELIGKPEDILKSFSDAVGKLTNPKDTAKINKENALGARYVLGRALANIVALPNQATVVKRSSVGFLTEPEGMIDIIASADSAFDFVEATNPACHAELEESRRRLYAGLVNSAVNLYNDRQSDSAEVLTRKSLAVYDDYRLAYIAYNILGSILQTKSDNAGAISAYKKMATLMKGDSSLVEERKNTYVMVVRLLSQEVEPLEGDKKQAAAREVVKYVETDFLTEYPNDPIGLAELAGAYIAAGDKPKAVQIIQGIESDANRFTDTQLFQIGVSVARAEMADHAATLFDAGLKKNPYSRDGLFNYGATLSQVEAWDKLPTVLTRLIEVDPENPDNYRLWALYYQSKAKTLKPAAEKKPANDPNVLVYNAANDSLLKYFKRFQEAPVKVQFSLFSHDGAKHVLSGMVENMGEAGKAFTLKFDFLDSDGKTVVSKEVTLAEVAGKGSKSFRVEVEGAGIVAFKYGPLSN